MSILSALPNPKKWPKVRLDAIFTRSREANAAELQPLSVFTDEGVVPRASRDHSYKALGDDLGKNLLVRPNDLVFNKLRTWQGAIGISAYEGIVSPAYFVLRPSPGVNGRFYHYLLRSAPWVQELRRVSKFMPPNQNDIAWDDLKRVLVPRPSIAEQRAIADHLDTETARIDALIAKKQQVIEVVIERGNLALVRALERRDTPWPRSLDELEGLTSLGVCRVIHLSQCLDQLTNGYVGPTRDILVDDGVPYVQSLHIKNGSIDFKRRPFFVTAEWHASRPRIHLRENDVLIVQTGDIGQVAVVPPGFGEASCHALQIARVRSSLILGPYLAEYLRSSIGYQSLLSRATGALHPHLEGSIRTVPILVPPVDAQRAIVQEIAEWRQQSKELAGQLTKQIELLGEQRRALITAAVTGELEIPGVAA